MADRTSATTFDFDNIPGLICGHVSASNDDTVTFKKTLKGVVATASADEDMIVSVQISGSTLTFGCQDDAGTAITADATIYFIAWV